jgi:hypothetical protein
MSAQGSSGRENPGEKSVKIDRNPERVRPFANPFQGSITTLWSNPKVVAALQPWAEISQRLRRKFKLMQHLP